ELLVDIDDDLLRLVYAEPGGRFVTRSASVQVFSEGENRTRLVWINDLLPNEFAELIRANMDKAVVVMKQTLEASARHLITISSCPATSRRKAAAVEDLEGPRAPASGRGAAGGGRCPFCRRRRPISTTAPVGHRSPCRRADLEWDHHRSHRSCRGAPRHRHRLIIRP